MLETIRTPSLRKKFWGEAINVPRRPIAAYEFKLIVVSGPATARHMSLLAPTLLPLHDRQPRLMFPGGVISMLSFEVCVHRKRHGHGRSQLK